MHQQCDARGQKSEDTSAVDVQRQSREHQRFGHGSRRQPILRIVKDAIGSVRSCRKDEHRHGQKRHGGVRKSSGEKPRGNEKPELAQDGQCQRGGVEAKQSNAGRVERRENRVGILRRMSEKQVIAEIRMESRKRLDGIKSCIASETTVPMGQRPQREEQAAKRRRFEPTL